MYKLGLGVLVRVWDVLIGHRINELGGWLY